MTDLVAQVDETIAQRKLLARGQGVVVAVSGGMDSMVLLHVLHQLAAKYRWKIVVAHFNHQLRGRSSDADEKLVQTTAAQLSLQFRSARAPVKTIAARAKESIEMTARRLRHDFLARTATQNQCCSVALAHHADDQVELFFLRLLRGAGGAGLAGMKWSNPSPALKSIRLTRPLLDLPKSRLLQFARDKKIPFREDATNASPDILRNRIRHRLLPLLRGDFQPALEKTILRAMDVLGADAEFVAESARARKNKSRAFSLLPPALQRQILQQQLLDHGLKPDFELIESLRLPAAKSIMITANQAISRNDFGRVKISHLPKLSFNGRKCRVILGGRAGEVKFGGTVFKWRLAALKRDSRLRQRVNLEEFDVDKVGTGVILRYWKPGDRFQPCGMPRAVKLQDWFVNRKVPRARRHELVVATTSGGEIFWVEGQRITEKFKLTPATRRSLIWRWRRDLNP